MTLAAVETPDKKKAGPSLVVQVGVLAALTLLAVGGGWFAGMTLKSGAPSEAGGSEAPAVRAIETPGEGGEGDAEAASGHGEASGGHGGGGHGEEAADAEEGAPIQLIPRLVPLEAVTTNLAAPADIWVRMELSLVFSGPPAPELVREIHQDILAYMRTVTLQQVQGASGFLHLKADLEERAKIRSNGLVTQLIVRTLLFE